MVLCNYLTNFWSQAYEGMKSINLQANKNLLAKFKIETHTISVLYSSCWVSQIYKSKSVIWIVQSSPSVLVFLRCFWSQIPCTMINQQLVISGAFPHTFVLMMAVSGRRYSSLHGLLMCQQNQIQDLDNAAS